MFSKIINMQIILELIDLLIKCRETKHHKSLSGIDLKPTPLFTTSDYSVSLAIHFS